MLWCVEVPELGLPKFSLIFASLQKTVLMYESSFLILQLEICQVDANTTTPTDFFVCVAFRKSLSF